METIPEAVISHKEAPDATGTDTHLPKSAETPFTRNEAMVHKALNRAGRPMKAYELLDQLHDNGLRAPMTIYRALEGLQAKGYAQKVVSKNAFIAVDPNMKSSIPAVVTCKHCGHTRLVPVSEQDAVALLGAANMSISNIVIEAVGDCEDEHHYVD